MSTIFDFTYKINSETVQNQILSNVLAASAKKEYQPISHFFVDETKLAAILPANYTSDAFGPVTGSETTKYRTTSKVKAIDANPVKVFAICDGQLLLQPHYDSIGTLDTTKINIIIKPSSSYNPLKIKYFIYRGVRKEDLIDNDNNLKVESTDVNQPWLLQKLWFQFQSFYTDADNTAPTVFPASLIGYDATVSDTTLIEHVFSKKGIDNSIYQLPTCAMGDHIANFSTDIGLDIVLDYGDYQLQNQEELFKFDLKFARAKENVFNTASQTNAIKIKRLKEHILQFVDAAAFWGSHIECGTIKTVETPAGIKSNNDNFTKILSKYQTQNKIYIYIQGENVRSYNYYDAARKVYGFATAGKLNDTSGWPITIEEIALSTATTTNKEGKSIQLEYNVASAIPEIERHVAIDIIVPNNSTSNYPLVIKPKNPTGTPPVVLIDKTPATTIKFPVNGTKSCATFLFLYGNLKQETPLKKYYNDLFPVNLNTNFQLPTTGVENRSYWTTYDKSRLVNLDDVIDAGAVIQNKVVFDNGKGQAVSGVVPRKSRRLYMAILKRNSIHNQEYDNLNIDTVTAGIAKETKTHEDYVLNHYKDKDFSVYKGTFTNGTTINALTLFHQKSLTRKNSFFHLGITEEEYNKLVYGQATVPVVTPPAPVPQILPLDADNVFFHLEEDTVFLNQNVTRYKLGFRFEDNTGNLVTLFPSLPANEVLVYTIDGAYFFSKEYSQFQEFYDEFAKAKVEFRTVPIAIPASGTIPAVPVYNGEFGFDWLRIGDNGEPSYESIILGGYERPTATDTNTEYEYSGVSGVFNDAAKALKREYKSIPTQILGEQYFIPYLNLFSKTFSDSLPATVSPKPPYEATLRVLVQIDAAVGKLEFDYDSSLFTINKPILSDRAVTTGKVESIDKTITITCLKDFSEAQIIKVLAYPFGVTDKKSAKLAGMIVLGRNDLSIRNNLNFVFVYVKTNVDGTGNRTGVSISNEKSNLINSLAHSNIIAKIEDCPNILDLSANTDYKIGGQYIHTNTRLWEDAPNFFTNLKTLFFAATDATGLLINSKYNTGFYTVFVFDTPPYDTAVGQIEKLGVQNLILLPGRNDRTLSHEGMHGLGLLHSHKDGGITSPNQKYVFANGNVNLANATDNYMSYSGALRKSTWKWQWEIIRQNL